MIQKKEAMQEADSSDLLEDFLAFCNESFQEDASILTKES
eukprot:CAMPEP_0202956590 /NCGR_PEP_ID=MMETSP1396-20130829/1092_1 /ASSEMBLY_ACC=CAM_ASM_000872 /TAXON_ID= /ORGANISM="Pseudokeronopsis sp., Strain Brazil" /LENGTH=39 /DNA_ID= /DNA_START= /DNA_END= /DNA_ORIENTATION=